MSSIASHDIDKIEVIMPLFTDNDSVQMRQVTQEKTNLWFAHLKVFGVLTMVYREKIQCVPPNAFECFGS